MAEPVVIRIEVTDGNSGAVIAALEKSFQQLGNTGAMAGKKISEGMATGAAGVVNSAKAALGAGGPAATNPEIPIANYGRRAREAGTQAAAANDAIAESANAAQAEMGALATRVDAAAMSVGRLRRESAALAEVPPALGNRWTPGAPMAQAEGVDNASAYQRMAAATVELNYVQERNREILAALRAGEVSTQQATLDLAESMEEQRVAALSLAEARTELTAADRVGARAALSSGESYGEARLMMGAMNGSMYQMEYGLMRLVSSSRVLAPLMAGLFDVTMIGAGVAMVGMMADGVYRLYEKWTDVDSAVNKYEASAQKAAEQKLFDTASLETANSLLAQADARIEKLNRQKTAALGQGTVLHGITLGLSMSSPTAIGAGSSALEKTGGGYTKANDAQKAFDLMSKDQAKIEAAKKAHTLAVEEQHTRAMIREAKLRGFALISQQQTDRDNAAKLDRRWTRQQEKMHAHKVADTRRFLQDEGVSPDKILPAFHPSKDSGDRQLADAKARSAAQAEQSRVRLARQQSAELAQIHEQALESGLRGEALYKQKMEFALAELKRKQIATVQAVHDVEERFHNERMQRIRQEELATERMERQASAAGLRGAGRVQAQGANQIADVEADPNLDPVYRARRAAAIRRETHAEMLNDERQFERSVSDLQRQSTDRQLQGYARIHAQALRQLAELKRQFHDATDSIDVTAPGGLQLYGLYAGQYQRGKAAIAQGEQTDRAALARRNADQTEEIEAQSRIRTLEATHHQTAAIEMEYEMRTRSLMEQLQRQEIGWGDYRARVLAAQQDMNTRLAQQASQARQKIADELRGLMGPHPLQALEQMGSKYASEAGAALLQRAAQHFQANESGDRASLLDRLAGHARVPGMAAWTHHGSTISGRGSMAIAAAEIHVARASFLFGGGSGSGARGSGGGSTWMIGGGSGAPDSAAHFGGATTVAFHGGAVRAVGGGAGAGAPGAPDSGAYFGGATPAAVHGGAARTAAGVGIGAADTIGAYGGGSGGVVGALNTIQHGATALHSVAGLMGTRHAGWFGHAGKGIAAHAGAAVPYAAAGLGLFGAFKHGGMGGALTGLESGAKMGAMVAGPIGAAIGAIGGAALGFFGGGEQARVWWLKNGRPHLIGDMTSFDQGSMDYLSATMDVERLQTTARHTLRGMGIAGHRFYADSAKPEIDAALAKLTREQKAGRSANGFSTAMYDIGADRVPRDGYAYIHANERIMPSDQNERITRAVENASEPRFAPAASGGVRDLHVHALDAKSVQELLMHHGDTIRAALNESYASYGGTADVTV